MKRKSLVLVLVLCLLVWAGLVVIVNAVIANAQIIDPLTSQQAYTTGDPNNADPGPGLGEVRHLGLATLTGRYAITLIDSCDWLGSEQNIQIWPEYRIPPWLAIGSVDATLPGCLVKVNGRMSSVQCYVSDAGVCDINVELQ